MFTYFTFHDVSFKCIQKKYSSIHVHKNNETNDFLKLCGYQKTRIGEGDADHLNTYSVMHMLANPSYYSTSGNGCNIIIYT